MDITFVQKDGGSAFSIVFRDNAENTGGLNCIPIVNNEERIGREP
ncbi:hypothetical protein CHCC20335_4465 [Bacillus paralicheniformis]|nr:hypothetical protein CHCC20335_4465 [Bacillus paralicheniformis]